MIEPPCGEVVHPAQGPGPGVIDLGAEIPDSALDPRVAEQDLDGAQLCRCAMTDDIEIVLADIDADDLKLGLGLPVLLRIACGGEPCLPFKRVANRRLGPEMTTTVGPALRSHCERGPSAPACLPHRKHTTL